LALSSEAHLGLIHSSVGVCAFGFRWDTVVIFYLFYMMEVVSPARCADVPRFGRKRRISVKWRRPWVVSPVQLFLKMNFIFNCYRRLWIFGLPRELRNILGYQITIKMFLFDLTQLLLEFISSLFQMLLISGRLFQWFEVNFLFFGRRSRLMFLFGAISESSHVWTSRLSNWWFTFKYRCICPVLGTLYVHIWVRNSGSFTLISFAIS